MNPIIPAPRDEITPDQIIFKLIRTFPCLAIKAHQWLARTREFDPDKFHQLFECASTGETLCALFILNVWNPGYADSKGWTFNLFDFMGCADPGNRRALLDWMTKPYWP
jgi:hypothetical protein